VGKSPKPISKGAAGDRRSEGSGTAKVGAHLPHQSFPGNIAIFEIW